MLYIVLTFFAAHSFASDITNCPSINAIKAEGVTEAKKSFGTYHPHHKSAYDTKVVWVLFMASENGSGKETEEAAIKWGNKILQKKISGEPAPEFLDCKRYDKCRAQCKYKADWNYVVATTADYY